MEVTYHRNRTPQPNCTPWSPELDRPGAFLLRDARAGVEVVNVTGRAVPLLPAKRQVLLLPKVRSFHRWLPERHRLPPAHVARNIVTVGLHGPRLIITKCHESNTHNRQWQSDTTSRYEYQEWTEILISDSYIHAHHTQRANTSTSPGIKPICVTTLRQRMKSFVRKF